LFICTRAARHLIVEPIPQTPPLKPQQYHFNSFTYTAKNYNVKAYQLDCKYKRGCACPGKRAFPIDATTGYPDILRGVALKQHSDKCIVKSGLDGFVLDGRLSHNSDDRKAPPKLPADISLEMRANTEEFGIVHLSVTPEKIWWMVKNWADKEYERNWFGLREDQVKNLAKHARTKLGFSNFISTV
jgi:hypothetical protein